MGGSSSIPLDKRIVIVGGGYAGTKLAYALMKLEANFLLIDPKDCFSLNVANVRAIVEPEMAHTTCVDYAGTFRGYFRRARVVAVAPGEQRVILEGGEAVPYHVLVIGTGTNSAFPAHIEGDKAEAVQAFSDYAKKIQAASRIAVIGGGAVGTEIAAEIATDFPSKTVTLIHGSQELLCRGLKPGTQRKLHGILDRMGIKLLLDQRVTNLDELGEEGPITVTTTAGETLEVDMVIRCTGSTVNSSAYRDGLSASMEDNGALKVNEYLQVEGHEDIFAFGDCVNVAESKLVVTAWNQADCVLHNLTAKFNGQPLKKYKPDNIPHKMVCSLGRNSGIGELKIGLTLPEFAVAKLKSSHMFIPKGWSDLGRTVPKSFDQS